MLDQLVGQVLDAKYRIDKKLGQGGMGAVYLAVHLGTARPVALKIIVPQHTANEEFITRFQREAKTAGLLRHPNIVNVTDFGFASVGDERVAYLVMEYLDGCPLSDILKEEKKLPLSWVVDILEQVCLAIDKAHSYGIIHRDLKPDNIWLEPNERGSYRVKVLDFGLAKVIDAGVSSAQADGADPASPQAVLLSLDVERAAARTEEGSTLAASALISPTPAGASATVIGGVGDPPEAARSEHLNEGRQTEVIDQFAAHDAPQAEAIDSRASDDPLQTEITTPPRNSPDTQAMTAPVMTMALGGALTQVGAVLGTPVYMSPEQCLGEKLDARTDIYSLGVIAYEMLAGRAPFTGNVYSLMAQHLQSPPPPLGELRPDLPRAAVSLLMTTLAKKPDERPASAAALATALRARAAGAGVVIHKAFNLYVENFPAFFRISLRAHLPLLAGLLIWVIGRVLDKLAPAAAYASDTVVSVLEFASEPVSWLICVGILVPTVAQLLIAPLRPVHLGQSIAALKKRLRAFLLATLWFDALLMFLLLYEDFSLGLLGGAYNSTSIVHRLLRSLIKAGIESTSHPLLVKTVVIVVFAVPVYFAARALLNYMLYAPAIVMEELSARQAFARSKELIRGSRRTIIAILAIFVAARCVDGMLSTLLDAYFVEGQAKFLSPLLIGTLSRGLTAMLDIMITPLVVISLALFYFKTRHHAGETLKAVLGNFQAEELPATNWQERMMKRLSVRISRTSKS
jgi:serine/threonine protein kinase